MTDQTRFPCACCGYLTLTEPGPNTYEICPVCGWENDRLQQEDPSLDVGANPVTLEVARQTFARIGASTEDLVGRLRAPRPEEQP